MNRDQWVIPFFKKYKGMLSIALFLGTMTVICSSALMFNSGFLISKAASRPVNILLIYVPIVLTRAFGIGRPVCRYAEQLTSHNWVLKMVSGLRVKLYRSLETDAIFLRKHHRLGDLLNILTEDIDHLEDLYLTTIFPTVVAWIIYFLVIVGLGLFSWWFALMMGLVLAVLVVLFPLCSVIIDGAHQMNKKQAVNKLYNQLTDDVLGISDWIFSQRKNDYLNHYQAAQAELITQKNKIDHLSSIRKVIFQGVVMVITLTVVGWAAFRFQGNHGGAANWIAAFVLSVFPLCDAFRPLSVAAEKGLIYRDSVERLNALPEGTNAVHDVPKIKAPYLLTVSNISFHYPEDSRIILNDFDLTVRPHEKIAILGKSGSGKSTLLNLLRGDLNPTSGRITLNGYNVTDFGDQISDYLGVIDQSPYLFNTSILNNIRLGNEDATEKDVWNVLTKVNLDQLVMSLPDGIHTNVTEAGKRFSGGERQRIALARILLKNPPIILLDEPTVGLDPVTEHAVLDTFFQELKNSTIIWVTHHLQGVDLMDRVLFMEDGMIILEGTPEYLMEHSQHFKQLKLMDEGKFQ